MFESDDYDQALSQLDFGDDSNSVLKQKVTLDASGIENQCENRIPENIKPIENITSSVGEIENIKSIRDVPDNHNTKKRSILNSHFDHKRKRKFPGPAGLLSGSLEVTKDECISNMEVLSQDVDYSPNLSFNDIMKTPLWKRLAEDTKSLTSISSIKSITQNALKSKVRSKKTNIVIAVVEAIDRFAPDPLITLRDMTGQIKCTLHRDAWKSFSAYIVSQYCAFILYKPTVITTGNVCKKNYLNITIRNISSIYSSAVITDNEEFPEGFSKTFEDGFTILKAENNTSVEYLYDEDEYTDILEGLDGAFTDDM